MVRPLLITLEKTNTPILIIDKEGSVGLGLYTKLQEHYQIVLVGGREPQDNKNLIYLRFGKQIPQIPSDTYGEVFYIVNSEKEAKDILPSIAEKAKQDKAKLFVIGTRDVLQLHMVEHIYSETKEAAIIVLGDIFGNPLPHAANIIDDIFASSKSKKRITLLGVGLSKVYPVQFDDVIIELLRVSFTFSKKAKLFFLHTQYPMTSLGIAHLLQKENPLLKIDFKRDEQIEADNTLPIEGDYLLPEHYPASEKLQKTYNEFLENETIVDVQADEQLIQTRKQSSMPSAIGVFFLTFIIFSLSLLLAPLVLVAGFGLLGEQSLKQAFTDTKQGNIVNAKRNLQIAKQAFSAVSLGIPTFSLEADLVGRKEFVNSLASQTELAKTTITDISNVLNISDTLKQFSDTQEKASTEKLIAGIASVKSLLVTAQEASQDKSISPQLQVIGSLQDAPSFVNVLDSLPTIFGLTKKQTYLVLFQNNAELRPGGGFIGSYGLLQVEKGKIINFSIHDVYDADGQLKGHIEPPFAIRRYMQIVHLFLRDSNFDVDFSKDAFMEAFMYQQETGQAVDGVIALDLTFVKDLIASVGTVYVPAYNETVTKDNFFLLAENHAEKNFFPGSSQKGDFLKNTFDALKEKLLSSKINYLILLEGIAKAAQQKDILFAFANAKTQDVFTVNNLSSSLWDSRENAEGRVNDFLGINEANIGINKVNYFVTRQVSHQIAIGANGEVTGKVTLSIINNSEDKWPGGVYKNYVRFVLPNKSDITKMLIDGEEQKIVPAVTDFLVYEKKGFVPPSGIEIEKTTESDKSLYGFLTTILPKKTQSITVFYTGEKVDTSQPVLTYSLKVFKQPGVDTYPYSLVLQHPDVFKVISADPKVSEQGNSLALNLSIDSDKSILITLGKK